MTQTRSTSAPSSDPAPGMPDLVVRCGGVSYTAGPEGGPIVVGRESPAQVLLTDPRVSRAHLRLEPADGAWTATDTSTNGTYLGDARQSRFTVTDGMTIHLGDPEGIEVSFELADTGEDTRVHTSTGVMGAQSGAWGGQERTDPGIARAGAAVAARREELHITQRNLARDKIMNAGALIAFEKGRSWPRRQTLAKLEGGPAVAAGHDQQDPHRGTGSHRRRRHRGAHQHGAG